MKKEKTYVYSGLTERVKNEWPVYLLGFLFILIADSIGQFRISVWRGELIIFPIFYSLALGLLSGPNITKILSDKRVKAAGGLVGIGILPFIAKLGINAGSNFMAIIEAGPALLLQEFGNLGTIFFSVPIALLLGLKREAIGACHSINRETNLALMQDMFGASSPEAQGSLSVYIAGSLFGTIFFGFVASMFAATGIFSPMSLGMASGVGAGILMSSAVAALTEVLPEAAGQIAALAAASETISGIDGIYMSIFLGIPLTKWLYKHLEPKLGRITKTGRFNAWKEEAYAQGLSEEAAIEYAKNKEAAR